MKGITKLAISVVATTIGGTATAVYFVVDMSLRGMEQSVDTTNERISDTNELISQLRTDSETGRDELSTDLEELEARINARFDELTTLIETQNTAMNETVGQSIEGVYSQLERGDSRLGEYIADLGFEVARRTELGDFAATMLRIEAGLASAAVGAGLTWTEDAEIVGPVYSAMRESIITSCLQEWQLMAGSPMAGSAIARPSEACADFIANTASIDLPVIREMEIYDGSMME